MENLIILLAGLAISQLLFLGSYTQSRFRHNTLSRLLVLFAICLSGFLLGELPLVNGNMLLDFIMSRLAILTPAALWLFSLVFFKDEQNIPRYGLGLIAVYFLFGSANALFGNLGVDTGPLGYYLGYLFPLLVMFGLSVHVVYMGIEGRRDDLLEKRRRLRIPFVISMGVVILFTLSFVALSPLIQELLPEQSGQLFLSSVTLVIYGSIFFWTLVLNLAIFRLHTDAARLLQNTDNPDQETATQTAEDKPLEKRVEAEVGVKEVRLMEKINAAMGERKLYQQNGFTIVQLAQELSASEQRLRTTINSTMGFRNFNQFLNHYRIDEAARMLVQTDEPIASIAMDVGYNSLSAFNKAFKEIHRKTPREFRTTT